MDQPFVERIAEIKESQAKYSLELNELIAERDRAPERLRSAFDDAIANLEASQTESLESYLRTDEVVEFVNKQAAQAREDISTIEKLASRGLISQEQRQQHIADLFNSDDYAGFLAVVSTAFEVFDDDSNPFDVSMLLATGENEDTGNDNPVHESTGSIEISDTATGTESADTTEIFDKDEPTEELEIIEVIYGNDQNRFFINGVEINQATYRHTVDTRIALIKAIAALPGGEPTRPAKLIELATEEFGLSTESEGKPTRGVTRGALEWIFENVQTPEGIKLAEHNGGNARAAKITRNLGVSATAQIVDSYANSSSTVQDAETVSIDESDHLKGRVIEDGFSDEPPELDIEVDIRDDHESTDEVEEPRRSLYTIDKLISPEFREHIRSILLHVKEVQNFSFIQLPEMLTGTKGATDTMTKLDANLLADARQLVADAIEQSTEYIEALIELYDIDEPTAEEQDAIELLQQLEDVFRGEDVEGYILSGHIQNAEETLLIESAAEPDTSKFDEVSEIAPDIIEDILTTGRKLLEAYKLEDSLGSLRAINMVGLKTRDLAIARDAGAISRGNHEKQGSTLSVEKLIRVYAYSKLRHLNGITVSKAEKITDEIIAGLAS